MGNKRTGRLKELRNRSIQIWDVMAILVLILTACLAGYFVLVFINPASVLNLLPPGGGLFGNPEPTYTITPIQLEPTWTASPTLELTPSDTPRPSLTPIFTDTPFSLVPPTKTPKLSPTPFDVNAFNTAAAASATEQMSAKLTQIALDFPTPMVTQTLGAVFNLIDSQIKGVLKSRIVFLAPEAMKLDETTTIELLLNPSLSSDELSTQLVERSDLSTSTAEPGQLLTGSGENIAVVVDEVVITDRMKAVLKARRPDAFEIQELHENSEQPISSIDTTKWRWSITAKEQGEQTLELSLYLLVKCADEEYWREVETYKTDINVKVTVPQRLKSIDWQWILGIVLTALLIPLFFRWYDHRRKNDLPDTKDNSGMKHSTKRESARNHSSTSTTEKPPRNTKRNKLKNGSK